MGSLRGRGHSPALKYPLTFVSKKKNQVKKVNNEDNCKCSIRKFIAALIGNRSPSLLSKLCVKVVTP